MNEAETRAGQIDPLLTAAGWGVVEVLRSKPEGLDSSFRSSRGFGIKPLSDPSLMHDVGIATKTTLSSIHGI